MKNKLLMLLLLLTAVAPLFSMDRAHFLELNKQGRDLKKKQDWAGMRQVLIEIGKTLPGLTPTYALRMASVETHLGNKDVALQWMERYANLGLTYDVAGDEDLKPLLVEAGWKKIAAQMERNKAPVMRADQVCVLPIADLMPEDLTFDRTSQKLIVSSVQHHSLYRVSLPKNSGECGLEELPLEPQAKRWPMLAVSFDPIRQLLWATSSAMPDFAGFPKEDDGKAALLGIDPRDGKMVRRFDLESGEPAVLGDMSVGADGTVYVTDSLGGGVYRIAGGDRENLDTAKLEKIADGLFSPQTPVLATDGKRLFVPEYPLGIAIIDLTVGKTITALPHPDTVADTGLDGMHMVGDWLIGVQNGTEPERIMRFHLNRSQTEIDSAEVVEQSTPGLDGPTHAIALDGWVYVLANVGWDKIDDHGRLKAGVTFTPPVLLRFAEKGASMSK